jgi:hypothetical protein
MKLKINLKKNFNGWNIPIRWNILIMDENASKWMKDCKLK